MPWRVKTRNAMEEESKVALTRSRGNNRSEKYNFFQSEGFSFKKWEVRPFIFQGKSTEALRGHRCSRLIRVSFFRKSEFVFFFFKSEFVFFFRKSEFVFWKSEFVVWKSEFIFLKIGVWFLKIGVCSEKNRSLFFSKSEFVFWKSEYWPQILCCHSALEFEQKQWQIHGRGRGVRPPFIFRPNWGPKTLFGDRPPPYLRVWMSAPPSPYLKVFIPVFR